MCFPISYSGAEVLWKKARNFCNDSFAVIFTHFTLSWARKYTAPVTLKLKTSSQHRLRFNALSNKREEPASLNDAILQRPNQFPDLRAQLMHFRMYPIAISADIDDFPYG